MRRMFWVGLGVAAGAAGPRWVARTIRRPQPADGDSAGVPATNPLSDAVGAVGSVAGRAAVRLAAGGARRLQDRVQHAVEGGRADARARERQLRRALSVRGTGDRRPAVSGRRPGGGRAPGR